MYDAAARTDILDTQNKGAGGIQQEKKRQLPKMFFSPLYGFSDPFATQRTHTIQGIQLDYGFSGELMLI